MTDIFRGFKIGDIIVNEMVWGSQLFKIDNFFGNESYPMAVVHFLGRSKTNKNCCNMDVKLLKLIDSEKRPMKNFEKSLLIKLIKKNNQEAKRELLMRTRKK